MSPKTLTILSIAAAGAVIAAVVVIRSDRTRPVASTAGTPTAASKPTGLFADLAGKANDVAAVTVKTAASESTIDLVDGQWRLKEKSGYPVDSAKVRGLILSLAALESFEPRTNRPELHKSLGVEDVPVAAPATDAATGSGPLQLTLADKAGQPLASVIVGNTKWGSGGGMGGPEGLYLRKPGDNQSYFAKGKLDVPREPLTWVNNQFADIARDRIRSVTVAPKQSPETSTITVTRDKPGEGAFVVQNIPAGKQLKDTGLPETVVAGLVGATFEDVAPIATINFAAPTPAAGEAGDSAAPAAPSGAHVTVRTWDGLLVTVETTEISGKTWWKLAAAADPDPFKEGEGDAAKPKRTPEEVQKEVAELNSNWSNWAYAPYSYKSTAFSKKLTDELKDPEPPAAAAPTAPSTPMQVPFAPPQNP